MQFSTQRQLVADIFAIYGIGTTCVPKILPDGDWLKNIHAAGVRNPESAGRQKVDGGGAASAAQPPVPNQECHGKPGAAS